MGLAVGGQLNLNMFFPKRMVDDEDGEYEKLIRAVLRVYRASLRKGSGSRRSARNRDAFARRKSREVLKSARATPRRPISKATLLASCVKSHVLDGLHSSRQKDWTPIVSRKRKNMENAVSLSKFSFHEDPNHVLSCIRQISINCCRELGFSINFDDEYITDIGAFLVFSEVWPAVRSFGRGGKMYPAVQKVLTEMGVGHEMGIRFGDSRRLKGADVWAMPIQRRRGYTNRRSDEAFLKPQKIEHAIEHFKALINRWLSIKDMELTQEGTTNLSRIFGELLDNAERHSIAQSRDGDWTMAAFMARRDGKYVCQIAVQSIGQSIADSFEGAHPSVKNAADSYAATHKRKGQSSATLKTLLALQDMVTTDPDAFGQGGTGMMRVIQFFDELANDAQAVLHPRLTIISGNSCIQLRHPYIRGMRRPPQNDRPQPALLWCNDSNERSKPPDDKHVFDLEHYFSGVLVSLAFEFDLDYLRTTLGKDHGTDANQPRRSD